MALLRGMCAVFVLATAGGALAASARPDLLVTKVAVAQQGRSLHVTTVTRNAGTARAPASRLAFTLGGTRLGARTVRPLPPAGSARRSTWFTIPRSVASGGYFLRVCADARHAVAEADERNNCRTAVRRVWAGDTAAPRFAGLLRATTCLPGPVGGGRSSRYTLSWDAAADEVTPAGDIVYDVFHATKAGGEDFASPTYTTERGATSFTTPLLASDDTHYFVVRARDLAGNRDGNKAERPGVNLCD
jgi:hypothetical protein